MVEGRRNADSTWLESGIVTDLHKFVVNQQLMAMYNITKDNPLTFTALMEQVGGLHESGLYHNSNYRQIIQNLRIAFSSIKGTQNNFVNSLSHITY